MNSTGAALNYTAGANAALVSAINAQKNFEVLSFLSNNNITATGDQFAGFKTFNLANTGTASLTKLQSGSTVTVDSVTVGGTTLGGDTGVTAANLMLTSDAAAASTGTLNVTAGLNTINVSSDGKIANVIGAVTNNANTTFNVTGSKDLTITSLSSAGIVNATDFTGKLTATGSAGNDSITVGSAGSVLTATTGADLMTFGAGADQLTYTPAAAVTLGNFSNIATMDKIVSFTSGADLLHFSNAALSGTFAKATTNQLSAIQTAVNGVDSANPIADALAAAAAALNVDNTGPKLSDFTTSGLQYFIA